MFVAPSYKPAPSSVGATCHRQCRSAGALIIFRSVSTNMSHLAVLRIRTWRAKKTWNARSKLSGIQKAVFLQTAFRYI